MPWDESGITQALKRGFASPDATEQPVVQTCVLAGVTVMASETAWGRIPLWDTCCLSWSKRGDQPWMLSIVTPKSQNTCVCAEVVVDRRWIISHFFALLWQPPPSCCACIPL